MSHTTSAMLSRGQCQIAVAGATGRLGRVITEQLLTTFKPFFSRVVALTRDAASQAAGELTAMGADVRQARLDEGELELDDAALKDAMKDIDIVVNALGRTSLQVKNAVAQAALEAGAKVYFPSEFGVDHRLNDFPGFDHEEWEKKRQHFDYVSELAAKKGDDIMIISVYTGLFLEGSLNPRFGFDIASRKIITVGPASVKVSFTAICDIARAVAQLAVMAMLSPASLADGIPSHVHIAGCTRSIGEISQALSAAAASRGKLQENSKFDIVEEDVGKAKEKLEEEYKAGNIGAPSGYIRVLMGEGKLDFSQDNSNLLVNPRERLWKWKTVEEAAREALS